MTCRANTKSYQSAKKGSQLPLWKVRVLKICAFVKPDFMVQSGKTINSNLDKLSEHWNLEKDSLHSFVDLHQLVESSVSVIFKSIIQ